MKKILLILFIATATTVLAQTRSDEPKSNMQDFSEKTGSLISKEITDVAKVKYLKFQLMKITDLTTGKAESGLRIEGGYSRNSIAFLDADELDGFIKTIDYCLEKVFTTPTPSNYIEYNYEARGGFRAGAFNDNKKWAFYLKLEKYISDSQSTFDVDEAKLIKQAIMDVKSKI